MHGQGHVVSVAALNTVLYQPLASSWVPNSTPMLQLGGQNKPKTFKDMLEFDMCWFIDKPQVYSPSKSFLFSLLSFPTQQISDHQSL
jgi:hypothetical protein